MYKGILYFETCVYDGESHQKRTKVSVRTRPRGFRCAGEDEGVWVLLEEDDCGCDEEGVDMFVECFGRLDDFGCLGHLMLKYVRVQSQVLEG